jgi:two-component SAPR family response regulator
LGNEKVIGFHDGKAMLDTRHCWVDVWAFERLLGAAFSLWERGVAGCKQEDAMILSERAIKMYTGPFLSGENEPWIVSIRERLRSKLLRLIKVCGNYYEQSGNLEKALECYQRGLEVDDLIEEFYQRMMKCNSRLGRRAEALSVYKRCSHVLSSVLGIRPSEETEALARELKK